MTCRHKPGDPECSSSPGYYNRTYKAPQTPDIEKYEILDLHREGPHMVLKVKYPNCSKCSYEGVKILVLPSVPELEILQWKAIDPHFRDPKAHGTHVKAAPPPIARFPATKEGWADARAYASGKAG